MMDFLKNFLTGEKTMEEKALQAAQNKHDVLVIAAGDDATAESCADEAPSQYGGCCGGGCRQ